MSKPRNLKVDLEICNRASKAPWRVATNKHPSTRGNSWGWVEGPRENWCWSNDNKKSYADAKFIAEAREGWPHAIERAMRAETLLRDILPMAMWESCMYKDHPDANPCTHCCDWNDFVERIKEVLGGEKSNDCRLI